jgi:glycosyltransferase involved in cell wall biosynthesis
MKIAVIGAKGLPPRQGGIEHYCAEVFPRIVEQGHSVDLFAQASYTGFKWRDRYSYRGVSVKTMPTLGVSGIDTFLGAAMASLHATRKTYDIIHFHALGPGLFSLLPRLASQAKIVLTCHGLDWKRAKWGHFSSGIIRLGEKTAVQFAHEIVVVSSDLQTYFQQTYRRSTVFISNAPASYADSDPSFAFTKSLGVQPNQYIVFLGRLVPEKRPDLLIQAFRSLQSKNIKLVLVGGNGGIDGFKSKLYELAAQHPNIIFTGELQGEKLAEIMRGARLFVLPSSLEGSPLALLEAMREEIPVVASDIAPHCELLEPDRGLLFSQGDCDSLAEKLRWALSNPDQMSRMAQKAQQYSTIHHSWSRVSAETLQVYESLYKRPELLVYSEAYRPKARGYSR